MKTLVVAIVIVMTSVFNAFSNGNLTQFAYNTTTDGEKVESQTVYTVENGKYLQQHLKYNYTYDDKGNVSQKEVMKWNEITKVFEKQYCLNITYNTQETSIDNSHGTTKQVHTPIPEPKPCIKPRMPDKALII